MKNKKLWLLVGGIILVLVLAVTPLMAGCAKPAEEVKPPVEKPPVEKPPVEKPPVEKPPVEKPPVEPEFTLRFCMVWDPGHPCAVTNDEWMDFIEEQSNGRVKFDRYYSATLVDFFEFVPATSKGVLEVSDMLPDWTPATLDWTLGLQRSFVEDSPYRQASAMYELLKTHPRTLAEYEAANLHCVGPWAGGKMLVASKKPITSAQDLRGLKLMDHELVSWEAVGAEPMMVPIFEIYDALVKGLLDAWVNPIATIDMLKSTEICHYIVDVGRGGGGAMNRIVNLDTWNKLPPDIQEIFEEAGRRSIESYHIRLATDEARIVKRWVEEGTNVSRLPKSIREELRSIAKPATRAWWVNLKPDLAEERWEYLALYDAYLEKWRALPDVYKDPLAPYVSD